ncbi:LysR family transcriptional regulator [Lacibacterium aquatile]|uniref:LysR family transcriptional regulator n=1 Tax=Lacibacterium aquatile TaxID=1168082 RepID=A0ABW5DZ15_9PROT
MKPRSPTLDQLQVFLAIVDAGSFAGAARKLGRATSVISYAISNLEGQLGLVLFDRDQTRKPQLTEAGRAMLLEARTVAHGIDGLLAKAQGLIEGLEAEVGLAVDVMLPTSRLVEVLDAFRAEFPTVALRLNIEALGAIVQLVLDGGAQIGISGPLFHRVEGIEMRRVGSVKLVPVAAPSHPLSLLTGEAPTSELRNHIQLVLTDRSRQTEGQEFAVLAVRTWRLADLGAKHALLLAGVGWGSMPEAMVADDLAAGRLVKLALDHWDNLVYPLQAIHRSDTPPGPAGRWLLEKFKAAVGEG